MCNLCLLFLNNSYQFSDYRFYNCTTYLIMLFLMTKLYFNTSSFFIFRICSTLHSSHNIVTLFFLKPNLYFLLKLLHLYRFTIFSHYGGLIKSINQSVLNNYKLLLCNGISVVILKSYIYSNQNVIQYINIYEKIYSD